ncbi:hypothetical protein OIU76_008051 [Salix suchowensis]|nr:hypothetical protein OIU76_008051 [Salix suchowensis]
MTETTGFSKLSDDVVLTIFSKLEDDPRNWALLACVCTKFSSLIRDTCWKSKCSKTIPSVVSDLLSSPGSSFPGAWSALHKLAVCCPGLLHAGVLLQHSDFGLERELGPDDYFHKSKTTPSQQPQQASHSGGSNLDKRDSSWSLFDDLYYDTVCNVLESQDAVTVSCEANEEVIGGGDDKSAGIFVKAREKRNYMLFRGIFKNFKKSRVWRTINDEDRSKIDLSCAFCGCKESWDLNSAFCLKRGFGYHDDEWLNSSHPKANQVRIGELGSKALSQSPVFSADRYRREDFPPGFIFGAGSSAYQVEGAAYEDGRSSSIWDAFAHEGNEHGDTGDVAIDEYHKYKVVECDNAFNRQLVLCSCNFRSLRRSHFFWARIVNGRGPVNPKGLQYYNNLVNELIAHGIQPHALLCNYDHPQALEDEYGGWISRKIVKDFTAYADVCFREFGDRVSHWTTVNEPNVFAIGGYDTGMAPPKRCSPPFVFNCSKGNSSSEPYLAAHHMLLAHASTARLYREKYQAWSLLLNHYSQGNVFSHLKIMVMQGKQLGLVGISLYIFQSIPLTNLTADVAANQRAQDFLTGWIADPLMFGDYPSTMKRNVGSRLPEFTNHESKLVKGSFDFIGLIHYNYLYVEDNSVSLKEKNRDFNRDMGVKLYYNLSAYEFEIRPRDLQQILENFKSAYGNPPIYIQENGQKTRRGSSLEDPSRVKYLHAYIGSVLDAIRNGSNTRGYFVWSLWDGLELLDGYESSYGLYYVDLDDPDLKRYPKLSAHWYSHFLKGRGVSLDGIIELEKNLSGVSKDASFSRMISM